MDYASVGFYYADTGVEQEAPAAAKTSYPWPSSLKFPANHLKILAFTNGEIVNGERIGRQRVLMLQPLENREMLVKFSLEAPMDGRYKLSCSYFSTTGNMEMRFMQRQNELSQWIDLHGNGEEYTENEHLGILNIEDGSVTVSVHVRGEGDCILHYLLLEKIKTE